MLLVALLPVVVVWVRRRDGVVAATDLRLAGWLGVAAVVALTAASFAGATVAAIRDISAGELFAPGSGGFRVIPVLAIVPVLLGTVLAGALLRVARRVDPAIPPAALPRDRSLRPRWHTVDYGDTGVRFPKVLPMAFVAPVAASVYLSVVFGNLAYDQDSTALIVAVGGGLGLVPLVAGVAWWPWLPLALTRGLRPGQVRGVGWCYLLGGLAGGLGTAGALAALIAAEGGGSNVLPGLLGVLGAGGVIALPGGQLIAFGARLRRAGLPPAGVPAGR